MKNWAPWILIAAGGASGSIARYAVNRAMLKWFGTHFPLGTFLVNVTGTFALGFLVSCLAQKAFPYSDELKIALAVGFLGAYTTFSAYQFESNQLLDGGRWHLALLNLLGSVIFGLIALKLGIIAGKRIF